MAFDWPSSSESTPPSTPTAAPSEFFAICVCGCPKVLTVVEGMFRDSFIHIKPMERKYLTNTLFCSQSNKEIYFFFYGISLLISPLLSGKLCQFACGLSGACNMCVCVCVCELVLWPERLGLKGWSLFLWIALIIKRGLGTRFLAIAINAS